MIWIYLMFSGIIIGIYGIYVGLKMISAFLIPFGVLKINTRHLRAEQIECFRQEWQRHSSMPLIILDDEANLDFHIGNKRLKDL